MLAEYKKKTNIGIVLAFAIWILGGILVGCLSEMPSESLLSVLGYIGLFLFIYGLCCYAKGKGYHGAWGLLGLFTILGLIILVCFLFVFR
ncbi:hypothetical protein ES708_15229 [subsurface metagenome]